MKQSTKDQVEGKFHEVKGKVKQKAGQAINSPDVESEGKSEKLAGEQLHNRFKLTGRLRISVNQTLRSSVHKAGHGRPD